MSQQQLFKARAAEKAATKRARAARRKADQAHAAAEKAAAAERKAIERHELVKVRAHSRRPPRKGGRK